MPLYPAIYPYISMRLQDSAANYNIPGGDLDFEITSVLRKCLQGYNVTYAEVVGADLDNLNEAAGLLVSARLITPLSTGGLNFDVASQKEGDISMQVQAGRAGGGEKERWESEAAQCLALISFITTQAPGLTVFDTANNRACRDEIWG